MQLLCLEFFCFRGSSIQYLFGTHIFTIGSAAVFRLAEQGAGGKKGNRTKYNCIANRFHRYCFLKDKTKKGGLKVFGCFINIFKPFGIIQVVLGYSIDLTLNLFG